MKNSFTNSTRKPAKFACQEESITHNAKQTRNYLGTLRLRAVERVTLIRFLFGMHPYQPTLDFAFFILE